MTKKGTAQPAKPDTSSLKAKSPKAYRLLVWDGTAAAIGTLNKNRPARPQPPDDDDDDVLQVPPQGGTVLRVSNAVSVRVLKVAKMFEVARHKALLVPIQLKNFHLIQSLLFRVVDAAGKVVYQEELTAREVDNLADVDPAEVRQDDWKGVQKRTGQPPADLRPYVDSFGSPFRIEVWVSKTGGLRWPSATEPTDGLFKFGDTQNNEFRPSPEQVEAKLRAVSGLQKAPWFKRATAWDKLIKKKVAYCRSPAYQNDPKFQPQAVSVLVGRPVCVVCLRTMTEGDANCVDDFRTRVALMEDSITKVEAYLDEKNEALGRPKKGLQARPDVRIFLGPEWFFRKKAASGIYTQSEAVDIIQACKTVSAKFKDWLIIPGTVFFGTGFATRICDMTARDLGAAKAEVARVFRFLKGAAVGPDVRRAEPNNPRCWFFANLLPVFTDGKLIHYIFKMDKGEGERLGVEHYVPVVNDRLAMFKLLGSAFLKFKDVKLALEVCRDHNVCRVLLQHTGKLGDAYERAIQNERASWTSASHAVEALSGMNGKYTGQMAIFQKSAHDSTQELVAFRNERAQVEQGWVANPCYDPAGQGVDVHLLSCCGVEPNKAGVVARNGGLFVKNDGKGDSDGFQIERPANRDGPLPANDADVAAFVAEKQHDVAASFAIAFSEIAGALGNEGDVGAIQASARTLSTPYKNKLESLHRAGAARGLTLKDSGEYLFRTPGLWDKRIVDSGAQGVAAYLGLVR